MDDTADVNVQRKVPVLQTQLFDLAANADTVALAINRSKHESAPVRWGKARFTTPKPRPRALTVKPREPGAADEP